jgi:ATP-binding cassette subfamily F protein uup
VNSGRFDPSAAGISALIAVEAIGPTPGIVISRRGTFFERRALFIATEGNGRWIEYAGGYTDMLAQRASAGRGAPPAKAFVTKQPRPVTEVRAQPTARARTSFIDQRALEMLTARVRGIADWPAESCGSFSDGH